MQSKRVGWYIGAIVLVLLISKAEGQNDTSTSTSTTTSTIMPTTTQPPPTTTSTIMPTTPPTTQATSTIMPTTPLTTTQPPTTQGPTTPVEPVSSTTMTLVFQIKFSDDTFDNATNGTTQEGKRLREILCSLMIKKHGKNLVLRCRIIEVRKVNSVVVKYDLVINATTREQAQQVVNEIQKDINSKKIGNYTVDPAYPLGAQITFQENIDRVTPAPPITDKYKTLIILLGVGLGLLVLVIFLLVFLCIKLRNKGGG